MHRLAFAAAAGALLCAAQSFSYPPKFEGVDTAVYKTAGDVSLNLYIFNPPDWKPADKRAAVVFFFGGGWQSGSPVQFERQARHIASRGMVAVAADYRVASRHGVKAVDCVRDAKSAIRWVRQNASKLGVDPNRIAAGGGSAGGHLAAATGLIDEFDEPAEDKGISSRPNALLLFNPAVITALVEGMQVPPGREKQREDIVTRMGVAPPEKLSPYHHIRKGAPPAIVFHGKADTTVPYVTVEMFCKTMNANGNRCELHGYEGAGHGFFNQGRGGSKYFEETLKLADEFLVSLGYLPKQ